MKTTQARPSLSRDFVLLSVVIMFMLCLASLWVAYVSYEEHSDKTIALLENEAVRIDRVLIVEIKNASYLLESLGRQISQYGMPDKKEHISRLLRSFNDDARKDDIFLWVTPGQHVAVSSNRGILAKPVDVADRDYVKKSLAEPWKIQIGRPIFGRVSEKWVLPISMGLTDFNGKYIGSIVVSLDINALTSEIRNDIQHRGVSFAILSRTLSPLTGIGNSDAAQEKPLPTEDLTDIDFDVKPSGVLLRADVFRRNKGYALYEVSSKYPYVILIGYDGDAGAAEATALMWPKLSMVLFNAVVLLLLLWAVRQRVIRPVDSLAESVENIVRGEDFTPLKGTVPAEIEYLSDQIRKLSDYLKERERVEEELLVKNTYLRRIKETAQLTNRARTQFLVTLSEEMEKPALAISEYAEGMKDQHFGPMENETYIRHAFDIYRLSAELRQMVADIHAISKMERGVLILHEKPSNVAFCLHRAVRNFQEQSQYKHIEVKLRTDENLPKLVIDEDRFNHILVNLLSIAAGRTSPGSAIVLEASLDQPPRDEEAFVIMLKYTLFPQENPHEMQQIRRIQSITESARGEQYFIGSEGINLALIQMLVSLHHGKLKIEISANHVCRIYLRFPESHIQRPRSKPDKPDSAARPA